MVFLMKMFWLKPWIVSQNQVDDDDTFHAIYRTLTWDNNTILCQYFLGIPVMYSENVSFCIKYWEK